MSPLEPILELVDAEKEFWGRYVLNKVNLSINKGEFITLLGPSGSGKTTILRVIGGFEWLTRGEIKFKGQDIKDLEPFKRDISTIFQDYALFPHLNVEGNIRFGLKRFRVPKTNVKPEISKKLLNLQYLWAQKANDKISKISQKQDALEEKIQLSNKASLIKRLQRKIDDFDFKYSFWENYVDLKTQKFNNRYLTRRLSAQEIQEKVKEIVKVMGLDSQEHKQIHQISGGMKQRVALARSLVIEPEVLLLDEPLSALDAKIRESMRVFLRKIQRKLNKTFILVTHDREEALEISDRIAIIRNGKIEQFDAPIQIYDYPINKWVANFIGDANIFEAKIIQRGKLQFLDRVVEYDHEDEAYKKFLVEQRVDCCIRPEDITLSRSEGLFEGKIISAFYKGSYYLITFEYKKNLFLVETVEKFIAQEKAFLTFDIEAMHIMEQENEQKDY